MYTHISSCQNRASLQGDFQKIWDSISGNLMKFYKEKQSVLYQGQNNPSNDGRLGPEQQLRSELEEKGLAMKRMPYEPVAHAQS